MKSIQYDTIGVNVSLTPRNVNNILVQSLRKIMGTVL